MGLKNKFKFAEKVLIVGRNENNEMEVQQEFNLNDPNSPLKHKSGQIPDLGLDKYDQMDKNSKGLFALPKFTTMNQEVKLSKIEEKKHEGNIIKKNKTTEAVLTKWDTKGKEHNEFLDDDSCDDSSVDAWGDISNTTKDL